jgi:glycosyltransferase involved in cell wall biosynthesis
MKILQIASIFPVSESPDENPYIKNYIRNFKNYHGGYFTVLKPISYRPAWLILFSRKKQYWKQKNRIKNTIHEYFDDTQVFFEPYFSIGSKSILHTFFVIHKNWMCNKRLEKVIQTSYNIVHAHFLFPDGLIAYQLYKKFGIPYILTLQQELRFLGNKYSFNWVHKIIQNASVVTTLSPHMFESLNKKGFKQVQLLSMGIEDYFFTINKKNVIPNAAERNEARLSDVQESHHKKGGDSSLTLGMTRKEIGDAQFSQKRKLKLVSVCNLLPIKNLESVIAAISKMPEKDQVEYTIYGTGPSEDTLKSLVQQLELEQTVHFKGAVKNKDLPAIMPEFDVFIQPSFKETFGLSYFEAMACGLPVILTRNTGAYEMIKDKDVYYLVDPHKPEDIMDCLRGILDDRETMLRKATLAPEVAKIASWDTFVDYFHHIYSHI